MSKGARKKNRGSTVHRPIPGQADDAPTGAVQPSVTPPAATAVPANTSAPEALSPSAGTLLRTMRERAGIELEVLASALKVAPHKLQALENDHAEQLPGLVFARGLAANICRYLGQDAQPVLARMPVETPALHTPAEASHHAPPLAGKSLLTSSWKGLPLWVILVILLLTGAAIALALWSRPATQPPVPAAPPVLVAADSTPTASATQPAQSPASAASAALVVQPTDGLLLRTGAYGDVWVQVRSHNNKVLLERILPPNSQHYLAINSYPIRVVVGRVENVQVIDRGKPFDTSAIAASGVARFQIR